MSSNGLWGLLAVTLVDRVHGLPPKLTTLNIVLRM